LDLFFGHALKTLRNLSIQKIRYNANFGKTFRFNISFCFEVVAKKYDVIIINIKFENWNLKHIKTINIY